MYCSSQMKAGTKNNSIVEIIKFFVAVLKFVDGNKQEGMRNQLF